MSAQIIQVSKVSIQYCEEKALWYTVRLHQVNPEFERILDYKQLILVSTSVWLTFLLNI